MAGPALNQTNVLAIFSVIGTKKTRVYISLVTLMATVMVMVFGGMF
ncbi:MAG: hypothetical protein ONB16_13685 [candidate division KSB1 bacterium]|nr:hypothetical protein [candidate division KSB1 bacterium]MDZ7359038.1 hypothetical protein [candidate division KSB1 bacterium]